MTPLKLEISYLMEVTYMEPQETEELQGMIMELSFELVLMEMDTPFYMILPEQ